MPDLERSEQQASHYFDPARDEICSFFKEDNSEWENTLNGSTFSYKRRAGGPLNFTMPEWKEKKRSYIFFHRSGQNAGDHEYIGFSFGGKRVQKNADEWMEYSLQ
jgi:hypothetical protein